MKYQVLKGRAFGKCCRSCINREFRLNFQSSDCIYMDFPYECNKCREQKNIVRDIRILSRIKLLGGRME